MQLFFNAQKIYKDTKVNQYLLSNCIYCNLHEKTAVLAAMHNYDGLTISALRGKSNILEQ